MLSISLLTFITWLCFISCSKGTENIKICNTPGCVKAAANILNSMDTSKDPCDNFFEYACGKWKKDNPIPDDRAYYDTMDKMNETVTKQIKSLLGRNKTESSKAVNLAKTIYRSCMDTETRNTTTSRPLISTIQEFGNWPLLDPNWTGDKLDTTDFLARIFHYVNSFIFGLYVRPDDKNATINTLRIDKGLLGLDSRDFYMDDSLYGKQMGAYKKYIMDHIHLLTTDLSIEMTPQTEADVDGILNFEHQLANITESKRDLTTRNNKWTIASLSETVPFIDWLAYFKIILPSKVFNRIDPDFFIIVYEPEYMLNLQSLLKRTDKKVLVNYGIWRLAQQWSAYLDARFGDIRNEFEETVYGKIRMPPQSELCIIQTVTELNMAVGALYAEEYFNKSDKSEALSMAQNLQQSYKDILSDLDWMDDTTKRRALKKLDAMLIEIGYPDYTLDIAALDLYYSIPDISDTDNYFNLIKKIHSWKQIQYFYGLLKQGRETFITNPTDVKAYISPLDNAIVFAAGILQPPLFESDFPKAVNYGGMGSIMGRIITYEFDYIYGSKYDRFGTIVDWWTTSTKNDFKPKMECLVNQYGNFTVPEINANINGKSTFTQNLVITGGIKDSFKAYKTYLKSIGGEEPRLPGLQELTNEQIFFLSFANIYCGQSTPKDILSKLNGTDSPYMFRVIGALINLPEFSSAFGCPKNSYMNPDDSKFPRCLVW